MYVVDITRNGVFGSSDMLVGKDSMDAKSKTIKYITDYALANHNVYIDYNLLDQSLDMKGFSLNQFMKENDSIPIEYDLKIQSFPSDKNYSLFVKFFDNSKDDLPTLYTFEKSKENDASRMLTFLVNDSLIEKYQDDLSIYENKKLDYFREKPLAHSSRDICCEIISLYNNKGLFMEELLNNSCSYHQLIHEKYTIDI